MENQISTILVPIDFSEQSLVALEQSYNLARLGKRSITLLHVLPESGFSLFGLFSKENNDNKINNINRLSGAPTERTTKNLGKNNKTDANTKGLFVSLNFLSK